MIQEKTCWKQNWNCNWKQIFSSGWRCHNFNFLDV